MTLALLLLIGCGSTQTTDPTALQAQEIELAECAVCGMVVGEQPSPRAQLAYRDGTHAFTCSLEEIRALATAPDARGKPVSVWVESLPQPFDVSEYSTEPLPWLNADEAHYVFGAERPRVMGVPVLSFADAAIAKDVAKQLNTTPVAWTEMTETPVPEIPPRATSKE